MPARTEPPRLIEREPDSYVSAIGEETDRFPSWVVSLEATTLRKARVNNLLSLHAASALLNMDPVTLGEIERGKLVPEDRSVWLDWICTLSSGAR